jgi:hypothetical protein
MKNRFLLAVAVFACLFAYTAVAEAKKFSSTPTGTKVASGEQLDIYVELKESKPWAASGLMLNIYQSTIIVHHTKKHGRQRKGNREEAIDADLLDASMWQVADFNGDGYDEYRFVAGMSKEGCKTWNTWLWLPDKERFTFAAKMNYLTDAQGNEVKSCVKKFKGRNK